MRQMFRPGACKKNSTSNYWKIKRLKSKKIRSIVCLQLQLMVCTTMDELLKKKTIVKQHCQILVIPEVDFDENMNGTHLLESLHYFNTSNLFYEIGFVAEEHVIFQFIPALCWLTSTYPEANKSQSAQ